ncbi:MAG: hypothetical protein HY900_12515 [Deltaproteobacteria bacterium]|nr:hypothetical protein [Deltaproteobacteria bacterium]
MSVYVGCDVGTVAVQVAVVLEDRSVDAVPEGSGWAEVDVAGSSALPEGVRVLLLPPARILADPLTAALGALAEVSRVLPSSAQASARTCVTGSGGSLVASRTQAPYRNECVCLAWGVGSLHPDVSHVCEIGAEKARFLAIALDAESGEVRVEDYDLSGDCAAGTGSFLEQQASRLRFRVEEVGELALSSPRASTIAGRCSVFAKTDMIHAQQKGAAPEEVLRGLCVAVARNFKGALVKGRSLGRVAFVGGVAANSAVVESLRQVLALDGNLVAPPFPGHYGAIGAALLARKESRSAARSAPAATGEASAPTGVWEPLDMSGVVVLRDRAASCTLPSEGRVPAYLGVDVGSVSTNLVCIDAEGALIHEIYLRTQGRPVEAVSKGLDEIESLLGERIAIRGVGTTGSGRELIGELLGADAVHDEITAHKTGAFRVARQYLDGTVDTIFEIGGQDSKYISLRDGVVVDFAMNEACAAGTGSFLEEQAEKLGVRIEEEFSRLALASKAPVKLGERCTVFMERDVARQQQAGAPLPDLVAGLAYAVVENYLNRVVQGRQVGEVVFFQGGTAFNDSVAAAFARVLGKRIVVPPHNGVLGAYGAALLAREKALALGSQTRFRGFRLEEVARPARIFTCHGCSNRCDIQEFEVEGRKSHWGDKCSERFRKQAKVPIRPVIPDLLELREEALTRDYFAAFCDGNGTERRLAEEARQRAARGGVSATVGVPRAMYFYEQHPFWSTFLRALGFSLRVSEPTTKDIADLGATSTVAEPCHPVRVAHGHAARLLEDGADYLLVPNVVSAAGSGESLPAYLCPWGQTLPFVLRASPALDGAASRFLTPTVRFQEGAAAVEGALWEVFRRFRVHRKHHRAAVRLAFAAQETFRATLADAGGAALAALRGSGAPALLLLGRPYNLFDRGVNLGIPQKLRSLYGANLLPLDLLPLDGVSIEDVNDNMYWNYGRKILQAARLAGGDANLHVLYLTNFKCGPDSYVKQFAEDAARKPFLVLQFDGHGNDAGALTRCEAYLDSLGVLRWWDVKNPSKAEPSSSRGCARERPSSAPLPSAA